MFSSLQPNNVMCMQTVDLCVHFTPQEREGQCSKCLLHPPRDDKSLPATMEV